jgi:DNA-binding transcriptional regulator YiaG
MRTRDAVRLAKARRLAASGTAERLRRGARLTLHDVARASGGVSHVTIMRWEKHARTPTGEAALRWLDLMEKLDAAFGESPDEEAVQ